MNNRHRQIAKVRKREQIRRQKQEQAQKIAIDSLLSSIAQIKEVFVQLGKDLATAANAFTESLKKLSM